MDVPYDNLYLSRLWYLAKSLVDFDSFSYYGLLVFFSHATLWPGPSVYCSVDGKDRLVLLSACF